MKLQRDKCIYCEQVLEGGLRGTIVHDLEHFRPKGKASTWTPHPEPPDYEIPFDPTLPLGAASARGYYLLAYRLNNYAAACKVCNSPLKSDFFPIAGQRLTYWEDPRYEAEQWFSLPSHYRDELPYLLYPLDEDDDSPDTLITFDGVVARPYPNPARLPDTATEEEKALERRRYWRARVIINFFQLNRDELHEDRARAIKDIWQAWRDAEEGDIEAAEWLDIFTLPGAPHASCARCFRRLCETTPAQAEVHIKRAREILKAAYA